LVATIEETEYQREKQRAGLPVT